MKTVAINYSQNQFPPSLFCIIYDLIHISNVFTFIIANCADPCHGMPLGTASHLSLHCLQKSHFGMQGIVGKLQKNDLNNIKHIICICLYYEQYLQLLCQPDITTQSNRPWLFSQYR